MDGSAACAWLDPFAEMHASVLGAVAAVCPNLAPQLVARITTLPVRRPTVGDMVTNAALVGGREGGSSLRLASRLAAELSGSRRVAEAMVSGRGFVTLTLERSALVAVVPHVLRHGWAPSSPVAATAKIALAAEILATGIWDAAPSPGHGTQQGWRVHYAHARCCSVLRAAAPMLGQAVAASLPMADLGSLTSMTSLAIVRTISGWPRVQRVAHCTGCAGGIMSFLYDLADDFDSLWHDMPAGGTLRFINPRQPEQTLARLALAAATKATIRSALQVLGVDAVEEMR